MQERKSDNAISQALEVIETYIDEDFLWTEKTIEECQNAGRLPLGQLRELAERVNYYLDDFDLYSPLEYKNTTRCEVIRTNAGWKLSWEPKHN